MTEGLRIREKWDSVLTGVCPMSLLIWRKRCQYCGEDTFGELGTEVDEFCSVCGADIREVRIVEEEVIKLEKEE